MNPEKWRILLDMQRVHGECHPTLAKKYIEVFSQVVSSRTHPRLLEVGLGEGPREREMLQKLGYDVTAITVRSWQHATQMDMHDLTFAPESFDVIYGCQVYEHSYAPWLALMESWIVLRPHGILFANMPLPTQNDVSTHPTMLTLEQWKRIYTYCGFNVTHTSTRAFDVKCRCEDDEGNPIGGIKRHRVSCNFIVAEKISVSDSVMKNTLEKLMAIHVLPEPSSAAD